MSTGPDDMSENYPMPSKDEDWEDDSDEEWEEDEEEEGTIEDEEY